MEDGAPDDQRRYPVQQVTGPLYDRRVTSRAPKLRRPDRDTAPCKVSGSDSVVFCCVLFCRAEDKTALGKYGGCAVAPPSVPPQRVL